MFFEEMNAEQRKLALARFKKGSSIFSATLLFLTLISVFYREFFIDFHLARILEVALISWFFLDEMFSKWKECYACAFGASLTFALALWVVEAEVGLPIFSLLMLMPLASALVALLGVAYFKKIKALRYVVLAILLFLVIKPIFG